MCQRPHSIAAKKAGITPGRDDRCFSARAPRSTTPGATAEKAHREATSISAPTCIAKANSSAPPNGVCLVGYRMNGIV